MAGGWKLLAGVPLLALAACGGDDGAPAGGGTGGVPVPTPSPTPPPSGQFYSAPALESLSVANVQTVIARAAAQASAHTTHTFLHILPLDSGA